MYALIKGSDKLRKKRHQSDDWNGQYDLEQSVVVTPDMPFARLVFTLGIRTSVRKQQCSHHFQRFAVPTLLLVVHKSQKLVVR